MTEKQIYLVQITFEKIRPIAETAAKLFYQNLFELDPNLRPLFKSSIKTQGHKLIQTLAIVVNGLKKLDRILPVVRELGQRHERYGVRDAHYDIVGEALLKTLAQGLGTDFTPEVREAWIAAYTLLADAMKEAAARAA